MESLIENKALCYGLLAAGVTTLLLCFQIVPPLNDLFELVPMSESLQHAVLFGMAVDFIGCSAWEYIVRKVCSFF